MKNMLFVKDFTFLEQKFQVRSKTEGKAQRFHRTARPLMHSPHDEQPPRVGIVPVSSPHRDTSSPKPVVPMQPILGVVPSTGLHPCVPACTHPHGAMRSSRRPESVLVSPSKPMATAGPFTAATGLPFPDAMYVGSYGMQPF